MNRNSFILTCLLAVSGLTGAAFGQNKTIPPPDKDIPHDKEPAVLNQVQPKYPASMLSGGWEATVYVKAFIDADGTVAEVQNEKIQILVTKAEDKTDVPAEQKTDGKAFEEAAFAAVKQWKFSPAQMQGKPVAVWVTIPFKFKLSKEKLQPVNEADRAETEKNIESIKSVIENILKGIELDKAKKYVSGSATLIYNTKLVNLYSVLNGELKDISLTDGKEAKTVNFNINVTGGGTSAVITWTSELPKGKSKRIHTIVLARSEGKEFKIIHWHVSF
jgi:TonB family protein